MTRLRILVLALACALGTPACEVTLHDDRSRVTRCDNTCATASDGVCDPSCATGTDCHDCDPPPLSGYRVGRFVDGNVEGLAYDLLEGPAEGPPLRTDHTGREGQFVYLPDHPVLFRVGPLMLGRASARTVLTVVDLAGAGAACGDASVNDRVRLLLTLDADRDRSNGIQISPDTEAALYVWAGGRDVRTELPFGGSDFDAAMAEVLTALDDVSTTVDALTAADHVGRSVNPPPVRLTGTLSASSGECERATVNVSVEAPLFGMSEPYTTTACTTLGLAGISNQIAARYDATHDGDPSGDLVNISCFPRIVLNDNSARELPYLMRPAAEALFRVLRGSTEPFRVNSVLRTLPQQAVLAKNCSVAAAPGTSNHEHGLAMDVQDWTAWRDRLLAECFVQPLPSSDAVHFEYAGGTPGCPMAPDRRREFVRAFQELANEHGETLDVDGVYNTATAQALLRAPLDGYPAGYDGGPRYLRVYSDSTSGAGVLLVEHDLRELSATLPPSREVELQGGSHTLRLVPRRENGVEGEPLATTTLTVESCPCETNEDCGGGMSCVDTRCVREGALRVTLRWSAATDLDLHVREPGGTEIYYANRSGEHGTLDRDNTQGGAGSVENVFFDALPEGPFQYWVRNYNGASAATFTLEVFRAGARVAGSSESLPAERVDSDPHTYAP